jgi:hypothetical protein
MQIRVAPDWLQAGESVMQILRLSLSGLPAGNRRRDHFQRAALPEVRRNASAVRPMSEEPPVGL